MVSLRLTKKYADSAKFSFPMKIQTQLYLQIARYITWESVGISCSCFLLIPVKSAKINRVRVSLMRNDNQYPDDGATCPPKFDEMDNKSVKIVLTFSHHTEVLL